MVNLDYDKTYNSFAEHPLAPLYFKYLDIVASKDLNYDVQHLRDIAHSSLTPENMQIISEVIINMQMLLKDDTNPFAEL
ncbi:MAG: hypothetical protein EBY20_12300, partial [Alphaproteobacteria bacterium]|nr:hypothetical protein [Alphaproteobacteria bacterium]